VCPSRVLTTTWEIARFAVRANRCGAPVLRQSRRSSIEISRHVYDVDVGTRDAQGKPRETDVCSCVSTTRVARSLAARPRSPLLGATTACLAWFFHKNKSATHGWQAGVERETRSARLTIIPPEGTRGRHRQGDLCPPSPSVLASIELITPNGKITSIFRLASVASFHVRSVMLPPLFLSPIVSRERDMNRQRDLSTLSSGIFDIIASRSNHCWFNFLSVPFSCAVIYRVHRIRYARRVARVTYVVAHASRSPRDYSGGVRVARKKQRHVRVVDLLVKGAFSRPIDARLWRRVYIRAEKARGGEYSAPSVRVLVRQDRVNRLVLFKFRSHEW